MRKPDEPKQPWMCFFGIRHIKVEVTRTTNSFKEVWRSRDGKIEHQIETVVRMGQ